MKEQTQNLRWTLLEAKALAADAQDIAALASLDGRPIKLEECTP